MPNCTISLKRKFKKEISNRHEKVLLNVIFSAFLLINFSAVNASGYAQKKFRTELIPHFKNDLSTKIIIVGDKYRINIGMPFSIWVEPQCYDPDTGDQILDLVTESSTGQPTTGQSSTTFNPNPVLAFTDTTFLVQTTTQTEPGDYPITISGVGELCGSYPPIYLTLEVAPVISGGGTAWWFNGLLVAGYPSSLGFSAMPSGESTYEWTSYPGVGALTFAFGTQAVMTASTSSNQVTAYSFSPSAPGTKETTGDDIKVTVKVNSIESDPVTATVIRPYSANPVPPYPNDVQNPKADPGEANPIPYVWKTLLTFEIYDQMGNKMPSNPASNEQFDNGSFTKVSEANAYWRQAEENGGYDPNSKNPDKSSCPTLPNLTDELSIKGLPRQVKNMVPTPIPIGNPPQPTPDVIMSWTGTWSVGSCSAGEGVSVQKQKWQYYLNHGDYADVVTPVQ